MCKDALNIVNKDLEPKQNSGIGYFITCPAKNVRKNIFTAKYILSKSFDYLYDDIKKISNQEFLDIGNYKRNETHFTYLLDYTHNIKINIGIKSLIEFNKILFGLESLSLCEYALSTINFIEEKFCRSTLELQSKNLIAYFIGAIGILFVSVGLNKASVLIDEEIKNVKRINFILLKFEFYI